jgi:hypothetical protein
VTYLQPGPVRRARRAVVAQDTGPAAGNRRRRFTSLPDGPPSAGAAKAAAARGGRKPQVPDTVRHWEETPHL